MPPAAEPMVAGQPGAVALTWEATRDIDHNMDVTTQLLALAPDGWRKLAAHNSYPGSGLNPTSEWRAGDVVRDTITLVPEGDLNGPTQTAVQVVVDEGDPLLAASTILRPAEPLAPPDESAATVRFGDAITLVGAEQIPTDEGLAVRLWWEAKYINYFSY